ncbi:hypothetical protein ABEG90_23015 [Pantoea agglomerans]|uniref:hypothetical protein n=1 Tax=Pantoea TaxID=53335 RepID=UPI00320B03C9
MVELRSDSLENFDRILGRIRRIEDIYNTETSFLLSTHKTYCQSIIYLSYHCLAHSPGCPGHC